MNIIVQGFGVVGASTALNIVSSNNFKNNFKVHCVEKNSTEGHQKILKAKKGIFPIKTSDKSLTYVLKKALKRNKLSFGFNKKVYYDADIIIVSINCDLKSQTSIKLNTFIESVKEIIENISKNTLILIESTVPPGTCENLIYPMMKKILKRRKINLKKIYLAHSFERVTPGDNYLNSCRNTFKVYSGINKISEKKCSSFLKKIVNSKRFPLIKLDNITSSETCKLMENSFRALNIAFIDEWVRFAEKLNIDLFKVIQSIKMRETHKNIMLPGIGVGGYCLTKDPLFAKIAGKKILKLNNIEFPLSSKAVELNKKMPNTSLKFIENNVGPSLKNKKVLIYGITYKEDIGDVRYSPSIDFGLKMKKKFNSDIYFYDPLIKSLNDKKLKFFDIYKDKKKFDIKILAVKHKEIYSTKAFNTFFKEKSIIFDLNNVLDTNKISKLRKRKLPLFILGR